MTSVPCLRQGEDAVLVTGSVNFATVMPLCAQGEQWIQLAETSQRLTFDLSDIECTDSAILPLITAWLRFAAQRRVTVRFVRVPVVIERIARACGLWSLIE